MDTTATPSVHSPAGPETSQTCRPGKPSLHHFPLFNTRSLISVLWVGLAVLMFYPFYKYSMHLAAMRIYQVDECQNVYVAAILAGGRAGQVYSNLSLCQLPLVWLARHARVSEDLFASARLFALLVFWLNTMLIAVATGARLSSRKALFAFIGAATLAPLWDYGFEMRHDNLLLTALLLTWCAVRGHRAGLPSYFMAGALAVVMQFTAFKAFVYAVPLSIALLMFPPSGDKLSRWKVVLSWASGLVVMLLLLRLAYGYMGLWDLFLSNLHRVTTAMTHHIRFAPWRTLSRLLLQTPLLLALVVAALYAQILDWRRRGRAALSWEGPFPETLLCLGALAALLVNPTPYPYNLVILVPCAFLLAFRYAITVSEALWVKPVLRPVLISAVIFTHVAPFAVATRRHADLPNYRQEKLMCLAERLTDPLKDRVYDGVGLVPTRRSIGYKWFLHSLNIATFTKEGGTPVRNMLAACPAAVIIPNYRTDWLSEEDHEFIRQRYVTVADDFLVLGKVLPQGGGTFEIVHGGKYRIASLEASDLADTYPDGMQGLFKPLEDGKISAKLDGIPLTSQVVELTVGSHRLESDPTAQPTVVWVGPKGDRIGRLGQSSHLRLFLNWY